ncbi:MAG: hypothetical protein ABIR70_06705 [Bryobacteraceae bacterium]
MSCPQNVDWNAYVLGEMGEADKRSAAAHLPTCGDCREELVGVQGTLSSLAALRDEEMPRRISFVSETAPQPAWWQRWNPMLASASLVAAAIVAHAFIGQAPTEISPALQSQIEQQMEQNKELQDQLLVLDQQNKSYQQAYKATMNLVTY